MQEKQRALAEARQKHAQQQAQLKKQMMQHEDELARNRQRVC